MTSKKASRLISRMMMDIAEITSYIELDAKAGEEGSKARIQLRVFLDEAVKYFEFKESPDYKPFTNCKRDFIDM